MWHTRDGTLPCGRRMEATAGPCTCCRAAGVAGADALRACARAVYNLLGWWVGDGDRNRPARKRGCWSVSKVRGFLGQASSSPRPMSRIGKQRRVCRDCPGWVSPSSLVAHSRTVSLARCARAGRLHTSSVDLPFGVPGDGWNAEPMRRRIRVRSRRHKMQPT